MNASLHRGALLHFLDDPATAGEESYAYHEDGALLVENGHVVAAAGDAAEVAPRGAGYARTVHDNALLLPGFIDAHVHYPQLDIVGAHGEQLLEWLDRYVFPTEARFGDRCMRARLRGASSTSCCATARPRPWFSARCIRSPSMPSSRRPKRAICA
jgi:cytosine/adenosine deaminase-related metal-dependent hydrolase